MFLGKKSSGETRAGPGTKARIQKTEGKKVGLSLARSLARSCSIFASIPTSFLLTRIRPHFPSSSRRPRFALQGRPKYVIDRETLSQVFHLPFEKACEQLGIGSTTLKRICREQEIGRWPYRRLMCADNSNKRKLKLSGYAKLSEKKKNAQNASIKEEGAHTHFPGAANHHLKIAQAFSTGYYDSNIHALMDQRLSAHRLGHNFQQGSGSGRRGQSDLGGASVFVKPERVERRVPKKPVKRNKSFLTYLKDMVWNTETQVEPMTSHEEGMRYTERLNMSNVFTEEFTRPALGKGKTPVKRSRSFLLQFRGTNIQTDTMAPVMTYDLSIDRLESEEELGNLFDRPTSSLHNALQQTNPHFVTLNAADKPSGSSAGLQFIHTTAAGKFHTQGELDYYQTQLGQGSLTAQQRLQARYGAKAAKHGASGAAGIPKEKFEDLLKFFE